MLARTQLTGNAARRLVPRLRANIHGRKSLQVVAFRDAHRAELLESVARDFSTAWADSLRGGPTPHTINKLEQLTDQYVDVKSAHPLGCTHCKGIDALKAKLVRDHKAMTSGGLSSSPAAQGPVKVLLVGANDASDTAFCLLELPFKTDEDGPTYLLLKLDIMLDDTVRRVQSVAERGQLAGGFEAPQKIMQAHAEALSKGQEPPIICTPEFPTDLIKPWAHISMKPGQACQDMVQKAESVLKTWVDARASSADGKEMMQRAGCDEEFSMLDAYGMLPLQCQLAGGKVGDAHRGITSCLGNKGMMDMLAATKAAYQVDVRMLDTAICLKEAAGFTHWEAKYTDKSSGASYTIEGMEVNVMDPNTAGLKASYLFRDALELEEMRRMEEQASASSSGRKASSKSSNM